MELGLSIWLASLSDPWFDSGKARAGRLAAQRNRAVAQAEPYFRTMA